MGLLKKLVMSMLIIVGVVAGAPGASAQELDPNKTSFSEHVDECFAQMMGGDDSNLTPEAAAIMRETLTDATEDAGGLENSAIKIVERMCQGQSAVEHPVAAVEAAASEFWGDPVGDFTRAVLEGNNQALQMVMTFWMDFRMDKNTMDSSVQGVKNIVLSLTGLALIASLIIGGGRLASSRRKGLQEGMEDIGEVIGLYLLFSLLVPGLVAGAVVASDELSDWIMQSFGATSAEEVIGASSLNESIAGPIVMLAFAGIAFAGSVMQIVSLAVRTLLLPIAAGLTPMMAAMSFTQTGKSGLQHLVSLMIASIIFKPVSALLYCVVFWFSSSGGGGQGADGIVAAFITAIMIGAAGFSGPALVRAIVPAVAQAGGGGAAPVMAGGASMVGGALGGAGGALAGRSAGTSLSSSGGASSGSAGGGASYAGGGPGGSGPWSPGGGASGGGPRGGGSPSGGAGGAGRSPSQDTVAAGSTGGGGARGRGTTNPGGSGAPTGAQGAGGSQRPAVGATARGGAGASAGGAAPSGRARMGQAARAAGRGMGAATRGVGKAAQMGAPVVRAAGGAATRSQGILDDAIGTSGSYHGQMRR